MENFNYRKDYILKCLNNREMNYATTTYFLLQNLLDDNDCFNFNNNIINNSNAYVNYFNH
jgi:hypothetical protein